MLFRSRLEGEVLAIMERLLKARRLEVPLVFHRVCKGRPNPATDRIQVAGYDGTVTDIGVRSTRLKTLEGRVVTIPNSTFSGSAVENVSLEPSRKVVLKRDREVCGRARIERTPPSVRRPPF